MLIVFTFHSERMQWTKVIMLELTIYAVAPAYLNLSSDWQTRGELICVVTVFFGVLTYILSPYTEEADRWFDFLGRILIVGTFLSIYVSDLVAPAGYKPFHVNMFSPW